MDCSNNIDFVKVCIWSLFFLLSYFFQKADDVFTSKISWAMQETLVHGSLEEYEVCFGIDMLEQRT